MQKHTILCLAMLLAAGCSPKKEEPPPKKVQVGVEKNSVEKPVGSKEIQAVKKEPAQEQEVGTEKKAPAPEKSVEKQPKPEPVKTNAVAATPNSTWDAIPGDPLTDPNTPRLEPERPKLIEPDDPEIYPSGSGNEELSDAHKKMLNESLEPLLTKLKVTQEMTGEQRVALVEKELGEMKPSTEWLNSKKPPTRQEIETLQRIRKQWIESQINTYLEK